MSFLKKTVNFNKTLKHFIPLSAVFGSVIKAIDGFIRGEIVGKPLPLASCFVEIEYGVDEGQNGMFTAVSPKTDTKNI